MPEDCLFVRGGGVSTRNYAKHVAPDSNVIAGSENKGFLFIKGVDVINRSPKSGQ